MTIRTISTLAACVLLSILGTAASANPKTGSLSGQVKDTRGRPIADAQVKIVKTGEITATDSTGSYTFTGEDPGSYIVSVSDARFKAETLTTAVQPDTTQTLSFVLESNSARNATIVVKGVKRSRKSSNTVTTVFIGGGPRRPAPDPFADLPQETYQGDLGLHSTARSR